MIMKRIFAFICTLCLVIAAMAQTPDSYVDRLSKTLPAPVSEGLTMKTATFDPATNTITFTLLVDTAVVPFEALEASSDIIQQSKAAEIMTATDAQTSALRNVIKGGTTVIYLFTGAPTSFSFSIAAADLK